MRRMVLCALLAQPRGLHFTYYAASISPVMLETSVAQQEINSKCSRMAVIFTWKVLQRTI